MTRETEETMDVQAPVKWMLDMRVEPVIPPWDTSNECDTNGAELQRAIIRGFSQKGDPAFGPTHEAFSFQRTFTFAEHGEFFRGALSMAGLRHAGDFYDLLQRYGTVRVTIAKYPKKVT